MKKKVITLSFLVNFIFFISSLNTDCQIVPKFASDIPKGGSEIKDPGVNLNLGIELQGTFGGADNNLNMFGQLGLGYIMGSEKFYDKIGYSDNKSFGFGHWLVGIRLASFVRIVYKGTFFGPGSLRDKIPRVIRFEFVPK